jgi:hypothetical protein
MEKRKSKSMAVKEGDRRRINIAKMEQIKKEKSLIEKYIVIR